MKREGWQVCGMCQEPLGEEGDSGMVVNMPTHQECAMRAIVGGLNHLRGTCTCCGGTEPPDPIGMTQREAARAACTYYRERERLLREIARDTCHAMGIPWCDPTTGIWHHPRTP